MTKEIPGSDFEKAEINPKFAFLVNGTIDPFIDAIKEMLDVQEGDGNYSETIKQLDDIRASLPEIEQELVILAEAKNQGSKIVNSQGDEIRLETIRKNYKSLKKIMEKPQKKEKKQADSKEKTEKGENLEQTELTLDTNPTPETEIKTPKVADFITPEVNYSSSYGNLNTLSKKISLQMDQAAKTEIENALKTAEEKIEVIQKEIVGKNLDPNDSRTKNLQRKIERDQTIINQIKEKLAKLSNPEVKPEETPVKKTKTTTKSFEDLEGGTPEKVPQNKYQELILGFTKKTTVAFKNEFLTARVQAFRDILEETSEADEDKRQELIDENIKLIEDLKEKLDKQKLQGYESIIKTLDSDIQRLSEITKPKTEEREEEPLEQNERPEIEKEIRSHKRIRNKVLGYRDNFIKDKGNEDLKQEIKDFILDQKNKIDSYIKYIKYGILPDGSTFNHFGMKRGADKLEDLEYELSLLEKLEDVVDGKVEYTPNKENKKDADQDSKPKKQKGSEPQISPETLLDFLDSDTYSIGILNTNKELKNKIISALNTYSELKRNGGAPDKIYKAQNILESLQREFDKYKKFIKDGKHIPEDDGNKKKGEKDKSDKGDVDYIQIEKRKSSQKRDREGGKLEKDTKDLEKTIDYIERELKKLPSVENIQSITDTEQEGGPKIYRGYGDNDKKTGLPDLNKAVINYNIEKFSDAIDSNKLAEAEKSIKLYTDNYIKFLGELRTRLATTKYEFFEKQNKIDDKKEKHPTTTIHPDTFHTPEPRAPETADVGPVKPFELEDLIELDSGENYSEIVSDQGFNKWMETIYLGLKQEGKNNEFAKDHIENWYENYQKAKPFYEKLLEIKSAVSGQATEKTPLVESQINALIYGLYENFDRISAKINTLYEAYTTNKAQQESIDKLKQSQDLIKSIKDSRQSGSRLDRELRTDHVRRLMESQGRENTEENIEGLIEFLKNMSNNYDSYAKDFKTEDEGENVKSVIGKYLRQEEKEERRSEAEGKGWFKKTLSAIGGIRLRKKEPTIEEMNRYAPLILELRKQNIVTRKGKNNDVQNQENKVKMSGLIHFIENNIDKLISYIENPSSLDTETLSADDKKFLESFTSMYGKYSNQRYMSSEIRNEAEKILNEAPTASTTPDTTESAENILFSLEDEGTMEQLRQKAEYENGLNILDVIDNTAKTVRRINTDQIKNLSKLYESAVELINRNSQFSDENDELRIKKTGIKLSELIIKSINKNNGEETLSALKAYDTVLKAPESEVKKSDKKAYVEKLIEALKMHSAKTSVRMQKMIFDAKIKEYEAILTTLQ